MQKYNVQNKPKFKADALLLIDCWGKSSWDHMVKDDPNWKDPVKRENLYQYKRNFNSDINGYLNHYNFDTLISATYRNPTYHWGENDDGANDGLLAELTEWSPLHYNKYDCKPTGKYLYTDCTMADIYQHVPRGGKIIVGGGSWGACLHFRPVGMVKLLKEGFRVFTNEEICYNDNYSQFKALHIDGRPVNRGIHIQDLLWDDILWSRCYDNNYMYPDLYEGMMVHPDNALGRRNPNGVAMKDT